MTLIGFDLASGDDHVCLAIRTPRGWVFVDVTHAEWPAAGETAARIVNEACNGCCGGVDALALEVAPKLG